MALTTPLSGVACHWLAGTYTRFEVSNFACYEDMNDDAKCRKLGGLKVVDNVTVRYTTFYSTLLETLCLSCIPFLRYCELFVESHRLAFGAPVGG